MTNFRVGDKVVFLPVNSGERFVRKEALIGHTAIVAEDSSSIVWCRFEVRRCDLGFMGQGNRPINIKPEHWKRGYMFTLHKDDLILVERAP